MSEHFIRIELPGGYARIVSETTYTKLVENMRSLAKSLENAQYTDEPNGEKQLILKGGKNWWKGLLTERPADV